MRGSALSSVDNALTERIIGAALAVHRTLGPGLLEGIYQKALAAELQQIELAVQRERVFAVQYHGVSIGEQRLDLIVNGRVILELKAVEALAQVHKAQLLTYLKISGLPIGLLINFGTELIQVKRLLNTPSSSSSSLRRSVPPR
ncbi:MAG: GxxExxY protein [Gemmatimonadales bacterium]